MLLGQGYVQSSKLHSLKHSLCSFPGENNALAIEWKQLAESWYIDAPCEGANLEDF